MLNISAMEKKLIKCLEIPCPPQRDHANNASKISENVQQTMLKTFFCYFVENDSKCTTHGIEKWNFVS